MLKHKPVSAKMINIHYMGQNSLLKFITDIYIYKIIFHIFLPVIITLH